MIDYKLLDKRGDMEVRERVVKRKPITTTVGTGDYSIFKMEHEVGYKCQKGGADDSRLYLRLECVGTRKKMWRVKTRGNKIEIVADGLVETIAVVEAFRRMLAELERQAAKAEGEHQTEQDSTIEKLIGWNEDKKITIENLRREVSVARRLIKESLQFSTNPRAGDSSQKIQARSGSSTPITVYQNSRRS
jgi:hypothetical protein